MAKQLGFHQVFRNRRAVDVHKRSFWLDAQPVYSARHYLFAGAGRATNQQGPVSRGHALDQLTHTLAGQ